jgi:hypothetical protein
MANLTYFQNKVVDSLCEIRRLLQFTLKEVTQLVKRVNDRKRTAKTYSGRQLGESDLKIKGTMQETFFWREKGKTRI